MLLKDAEFGCKDPTTAFMTVGLHGFDFVRGLECPNQTRNFAVVARI